MAIQTRNPNLIYLGGGDGPGGESGITVIEDYTAGAEIIPGMVIEPYRDALTLKWRPFNTAGGAMADYVALERLENNNDIDHPYAIADLVKVAKLHNGSFFYGIVPSGEDIAIGDLLDVEGGKLVEAADTTAAANVTRFRALESIGAVTADTRLRAEKF